MKKIFFNLTIGLLLAAFLVPQGVWAADFNLNYIISDYEATDYDCMTLKQIQNFLESYKSTLATKSFIDFFDVTKTAAEIIYNAAQNNRISPRYLLTVLQKEQSLIEDPSPTDRQYRWATGYGVCDGCDLSDPRIALFGGFGNQVELAARITRKYLDKPYLYNYQVGKTYTIYETYASPTSYSVTPQNQITAALYNYTPFRLGNYSFWKIWNLYFKRTYPDGTLLATKDNPDQVYLMQDGAKRLFLSKASLVSRFDPKKILYIADSDLNSINTGQPIKFQQYSLIRSTTTKKIYLIVDDTKRQIADDKTFKMIGFNPEEISEASEAELAYYTTSTPITTSSSYPVGTVLQDKTSKKLYYAEAGSKYPIANQEILKLRFKDKKVVTVSNQQLTQLFNGPAIKLADGELIKTAKSSDIYVISKGWRRLIVNQDLFNKMGYQKENIITVSQETMDLHPVGDVVQVDGLAVATNSNN